MVYLQSSDVFLPGLEAAAHSVHRFLSEHKQEKDLHVCGFKVNVLKLEAWVQYVGATPAVLGFVLVSTS